MGVAGEADAVRVQHHQRDVAAFSSGQHVEDLRVDRGLAAGELNGLGLALGPDEGVEHRVDLLQRQAVAVLLWPGAGVGEADRAVEVARGVDLDDPQAGVLGMLRADTTIVWAAIGHLRLSPSWALPRLVEALDLHVALRVPVDDGFEEAVVRTLTTQDHPTAPYQQLRIENELAARAYRLGAGQRLASRVRRVARHTRRRVPRPLRGPCHTHSDTSTAVKDSSALQGRKRDEVPARSDDECDLERPLRCSRRK